MRLLVVSDIHSNLAALQKVLVDAGDFDAVICAGDLVGYGPNPNECVKTAIEQGFRCVAGNHDYAVATGEALDFNPHAYEAIEITRRIIDDEASEWLRHLPYKLIFNMEGVKVAVFHGSPSEPLNEYVFPMDAELRATAFMGEAGADLLTLGHTHIPYMIESNGGMLINPGSVGQPRDRDPRASYMITEIKDGAINISNRRIEYDIDETASRMRRLGLPEFLALRLYHGY